MRNVLYDILITEDNIETKEILVIPSLLCNLL